MLEMKKVDFKFNSFEKFVIMKRKYENIKEKAFFLYFYQRIINIKKKTS